MFLVHTRTKVRNLDIYLIGNKINVDRFIFVIMPTPNKMSKNKNNYLNNYWSDPEPRG